LNEAAGERKSVSPTIAANKVVANPDLHPPNQAAVSTAAENGRNGLFVPNDGSRASLTATAIGMAAKPIP
jgi:hypothetical protein